MPSEPTRPPQRAWRKNVSTDTKTDALRRWQRPETAAARTGGGWSWKTKAGVGIGLVLVLFGGVIGLFWLLNPPQAPYLVTVGADYQENLAIPHNVYGWRGAAELVNWAQRGTPSLFGGRKTPRPSTSSPKPLVGDWSEPLRTNFREKSLVLYLAFHGGVDEKGPFLFLDEVNGLGRKRLHIQSVLDELKKPELADKPKLLILDATQVQSNWPTGILHNAFAEELEAKIRDVPKLVVLSASAKNQQSWTSEEWGATIFGHYVLEGIKGFADADQNGRVSVFELHEYVRREVRNWAYANRLAVQTPQLLPSDDASKEFAKDFTLAVTNSPQAESPKVAPEMSKLQPAWKKFDQLRSQSVPPAAYSPHRWRLYIDTLLRYEEVIRAGGDRADALHGKLVNLQQELESASKLSLKNCQWNSLAMPTAMGVSTVRDEVVDKAFEELWNAPEKRAAWDPIANRDPSQLAWQLSRFVCDKLLVKDLASPDVALLKAANLLGFISPENNVLPGETHSLAVMWRDMAPDTRPPATDVIEMLRLRVEAEALALSLTNNSTGYAYSEQVLPWIRDEVKKCDQERRLGEDLLISSVVDGWKKAREHRIKAEEHFKLATKIADAVRRGYQTRNRVLSELPYYSQWLVRHHLHDDTPKQRQEYQEVVRRLLPEAEQAWASVHMLARTLDTPESAFTQVTEQTRAAERAFSELEGEYSKVFKVAIAKAGSSQSPWLEIQDALTVPFMTFEDRVGLLNRSRMISQDLNNQDLNKLTQSPEGGPTVAESEQDREQIARINMDRNYRIAAATLGETKLESPDATMGRRLAERWHERVMSLPNTPNKSKQTLDEARVALSTIESQCRQIDGAGIDSRGGLGDKNDPVRTLRQIRIHDLLAWQAKRTISDHWFSRAEEATPYYRAAAGRYLQAAQEQVAEEWRESVAKAFSDLEKPALLAVVPQKDPINVIKEQRTFQVAATLQPNGDVPAGYPVLWLHQLEKEGEKHNLKLGPEENKNQYYSHIEHGAVGTGSAIKFDLTLSPNVPDPPYPEAIPAQAVVEGRYRGQFLKAPINVQLHMRPHIAARRDIPKDVPNREDCGVAVVADDSVIKQFGAGNSAIAVVLDCSGSMKHPPDTRQRFDEAINAIQDVLGKVRRGTEVSFWVFGQKKGSSLVEKEEAWKGTQRDPKTNDFFEYTVGRVKGTPLSWNPDDAARFIKDRVRQLDPWSHTAAVKAVMAAKKDLDKFKGRGFKTLLLVTDGADNHFEHDAELNGGERDIGKFLRGKFRDSGIQLNVVGFNVDEDQEKFKKQFEPIKQMTPPGNVYDVKNKDELVKQIIRSLKQELTFQVEEGDQNEVITKPQRVTPMDQRPGVAALDEAKVHLVRLAHYRQRVLLNAGDVLTISAKERNGRVAFERFLFTDHLANRGVGMKSADVRGWRLAALQNQLKPDDRSHQMFLTLEETAKLGANEEEDLRQIHPEFVWFDVEAEGAKPVAVRWKNEPYYAAPAWSLDVVQWPKAANGEDATPILRAWWRSKREPDEFSLPPKSEAGNLTDRYRAGSETVDGVTIESVEFGTQQQGFEKPCLVVRLRHPAHKPALARLANIRKKYDREFRVYRDANVTVTIYWDVTESELNRNDITLNAISLEEFKPKSDGQAASGRHEEHLWAEIKIPTSSNTRPEPWMTPKESGSRNP